MPDTPLIDMVPIADVLVQARRLTPIANAAQAQTVADILAVALDFKATVGRTFDEHIARAHEAHRALIAEKRTAQTPALEVETLARGLLARWATSEQDRIRRETAARDVAHDARVVELEASAIAAEDAGDLTLAEATRIAIATEPPPVVEARAPIAGVSVRETWLARVDDLGALVRAAASHTPWLALLLPNQRALDQQAKSLQQRLQIPGVTPIRVTSIATRRRT